MAWLIALDIDGTTIHYDGRMSDRVRDAVCQVAAAGHHVVLATGRTVMGTLPIAAELGIAEGPAVCSNGAVSIQLDASDAGHHVVRTVTFDPAPVLERLRDAWPDGLVAVEEVGVGHKVSAPFPDGELLADQTVVSWEELASGPATRITFRSPSGTSADFLALVDRLGLHGVNYSVGFTAWLDFTPEGVSKGSALELVRQELGVAPEHTLAVGDQRNDLEMLAWASRGVAMGQAPEEVLAAADEVTATVEDDGVAVVLENLLATSGRVPEPERPAAG